MKATINRHFANIFSDEDTPLSVCWSGSIETSDSRDEDESMTITIDEIHWVEVVINGQGYAIVIPEDKINRFKNQIIDDFENFERPEEEYDPNFNGNKP